MPSKYRCGNTIRAKLTHMPGSCHFYQISI